MSDTIHLMSNPTDPVIVIGATSYPVRKFVTAKFLRAMGLVSKLVDEGGVAKLFTSTPDESGLNTLLKGLPDLLEKGEPYLLKFCALTLTPNAKLRELDEGDGDVDAYLTEFARNLNYEEEYTVDLVIDTVAAGIEQMGVSAIRKNVSKLQNLFRSN